MLFENDGCTLWFNQWRGQSLADCCAVHDEAFATGASLEQFWQANTGLLGCVWQINPLLAVLMFLGVCSPVALLLFVLGRKRSTAPGMCVSQADAPD